MVRHTKYKNKKKIIKFSENVKFSREIALSLLIGKSTMNDVIARYCAGYSLEDSQHSGRPQKASKKGERAFIHNSTTDVRKTAAQMHASYRMRILPMLVVSL
jgi:transposase